jgi:hypothetical protein
LQKNELKRLKGLHRAESHTLTPRRRPASFHVKNGRWLPPLRRMETKPMEALNAVERIIRDLLIFVVAMSVVLAALMVIISRMPNDNPLKRIMVALSYRVGATAAAGMLVIPSTPIPGLDAAIDIGAPIALLWYWWTFFRDVRRAGSKAAAGRERSEPG